MDSFLTIDNKNVKQHRRWTQLTDILLQSLCMVICFGIEAIGGFLIVWIKEHHAETDDRLLPIETAKIDQRTELRDEYSPDFIGG